MIQLFHGNCLDIMPTLPAQSVDAVITDLPYGTTACKWDTVIPFAPMWEAVKHVLKPKGAFVTTASQPFTSALVMSNPKWFKYEWIWNKGNASNFQMANTQPMRYHENILVFSSVTHTYNPEMKKRNKDINTKNWNQSRVGKTENSNMGSKVITKRKYTHKYPSSIIDINSRGGECNNIHKIHPTQKPVALYEYLIKTYTHEGDTVLDMAFGSCTTGEACINTGRNFIGIEKDEKYFQIGKNRLGAQGAWEYNGS